jgi:hypothetical protein
LISLNSQNILFAIKENAIRRCSKPEDAVRSLTLIGLDFPLTTLIGIVRKKKQFLTYTQKIAREKLEQLCSA